jgi:hypothetical protein
MYSAGNKPLDRIKHQEDEKDVGGKGEIEAEVLENRCPTWNLAVAQSYEGKGQSQEKYEPKKIKRTGNKLVQIRRPSIKHDQGTLKRRSIFDVALSRYGA